MRSIKHHNFELLQRLYAFELRMAGIVGKYPIKEKWVLSAETRAALTRAMRYCLKVRHAKGAKKAQHLANLDDELDFLKYLVRKGYDLKYIRKEGLHRELAKELIELGKMCGQMIKNLEA